MAFTAAVEWDVRTTGSDLSGGGFAVGSGGTDYSQQDSPQVTFTDLVIDGAVNTNCTSAGNPFTSVHVGNIINITSGTGFTVQRVQIISVATGVATCDKSLGTLGSTGGNGRLGGALATPGQAGALHVAGNDIHVRTGTYTITSATVNVAGGCVSLTAGTNADPTTIIGYQATHRDGGTRPLLQASGISAFSVLTGTSATMASYISIDCAARPTSIAFNAVSMTYRCKAANATTTGFNGATAVYCEATGCSGTPFSALFCVGCVSYGNTTNGFNGTTMRAVFCLSINNTGGSSHGFNGSAALSNCVAYGNGGNGFHRTATFGAASWANCLSVGNAGYQFSASAADANIYLLACAAKADGSGTIGPNLTAPTVGFVTLTADPFVNAAGGDFSLNAVSGGGLACRAAGLLGAFPGSTTINTTGYQDIGAAQHLDSIISQALTYSPTTGVGAAAQSLQWSA